MNARMDCRRAEDLLSDHLEGTLGGVLGADLEAHLAECAACARLREALGDVVAALWSFPAPEPAPELAERAAERALAGRRFAAARPRPERGRFLIPVWLEHAAAGVALVIAGVLLLVVGPEAPNRAAGRLAGPTVEAGTYLLERGDRLVEDVRILGVGIAAAFEGRLDSVTDRVDDYRRLLQRRRGPEEDSKKRESGLGAPAVLSVEFPEPRPRGTRSLC